MRTALYISWFACFGFGGLALSVFTLGLLRDHRVGEPRVPVELAGTSGWVSDQFRVWRSGSFQLSLSSVNHTPPYDLPYDGTLEVEVDGPGGVPFHRGLYRGQATDHVRPSNLSWSVLDSLQLPGTGAGRWRLAVRVAEADPQFSSVASVVHLRRDRPDPGMGGMINYVMLLPAAGLLLISLVLGLALQRTGASSAPLVVSIVALAGLAATRLIR